MKKVKEQLRDIEDRIAKICIVYGEGKISIDEFNKLCKQANDKQYKILKAAKLL